MVPTPINVMSTLNSSNSLKDQTKISLRLALCFVAESGNEEECEGVKGWEEGMRM